MICAFTGISTVDFLKSVSPGPFDNQTSMESLLIPGGDNTVKVITPSASPLKFAADSATLM